MQVKNNSTAGGVYPLPPLILHPLRPASGGLAGRQSADGVLFAESEGFLDRSEKRKRQSLEACYAEFCMLLYAGKDLFRWMELCAESCNRNPDLSGQRLPLESFAQLLIEQTPRNVASKLASWGVPDSRCLFSRAVGVYCQFQEPPAMEILQDEYLGRYYGYADSNYAEWSRAKRFPVLSPAQFPFALYASGEYSQILEEHWSNAL